MIPPTCLLVGQYTTKTPSSTRACRRTSLQLPRCFLRLSFFAVQNYGGAEESDVESVLQSPFIPLPPTHSELSNRSSGTQLPGQHTLLVYFPGLPPFGLPKGQSAQVTPQLGYPGHRDHVWPKCGNCSREGEQQPQKNRHLNTTSS